MGPRLFSLEAGSGWSSAAAAVWAAWPRSRLRAGTVAAVPGREGSESAAVAEEFGADAVHALELRNPQERRRAVLARAPS